MKMNSEMKATSELFRARVERGSAFAEVELNYGREPVEVRVHEGCGEYEQTDFLGPAGWEAGQWSGAAVSAEAERDLAGLREQVLALAAKRWRVVRRRLGAIKAS